MRVLLAWIALLFLNNCLSSQMTSPATISQLDSPSLDEWVSEHVRYFDTLRFDYNWTEMLESQSENSFTVVLSVYTGSWYPKLKFGATFHKALESHFGATGEIWNYDYE